MSLFSGVLGALWLLGLLAAAPALGASGRYPFADRLRDALVLGVAIPLGLGALNLLYPALCWVLVAAYAFNAYRRRGSVIPRDPQPAPYLLVGALALIAWPQLMRPLLDGDSISYHLPNAAAWVHAHGLWTTDTRYWWYPPGSELFASGLYAVAGPFAATWSGLGPLALVGFRIVTWARDEFGAPPWLADALAAATVTAAPLALQGGTLQNDVWLAAFVLETLWTARRSPAVRAVWPAIVTALIKPYGWLFAFGAAFVSRAKAGVWVAAAGACALWILHDVLLARSALIPPLGATYYNGFDSTIAAHGAAGLALLATVTARVSPFALLALLGALAGPAIAGRDLRVVGWLALGAVLFYLIVPWGYADAIPQLATGASLRYAIPAIVLGALLLARPACRAPLVSTILLVLSAVWGAAGILAIYWNDAPARTAFAAALLAVGAVAAMRSLRSAWPGVAALAVAVIAATILAARQPADYYTDALQAGGKSSGLYAWIARTRPPAVGGWGLRLGSVNVLSPSTRTIDLPESDPCGAARAQHVLLIAVAESSRTPEFNAQRLSAARACGTVRFDDGTAVVTATGLGNR